MISLETYKLIEEHRVSFDESHDEILKRTLSDLKPASNFSISNSVNNSGLFWKGIFIENDTELRANYKGILHTAIVQNGRIFYKGRDYKSPSAAAIEATGTNINGWLFWEYYDAKTNAWTSISKLRHK
jgi:hypothetical protein